MSCYCGIRIEVAKECLLVSSFSVIFWISEANPLDLMQNSSTDTGFHATEGIHSKKHEILVLYYTTPPNELCNLGGVKIINSYKRLWSIITQSLPDLSGDASKD